MSVIDLCIKVRHLSPLWSAGISGLGSLVYISMIYTLKNYVVLPAISHEPPMCINAYWLRLGREHYPGGTFHTDKSGPITVKEATHRIESVPT